MKRIYEQLLRSHLDDFPCVAIFGPRQCGKTTLIETLPEQWRRFDLERASDRDIVSRDPDLFLRLNPDKVAIDEAQVLPSLFPALRVAIDSDRGRRGRFVITGSSSPELQKVVSESLAGRVAVIEMGPLSFAETRQFHDSAFFDALVQPGGDLQAAVRDLRSRSALAEVHDYWFKGGYPEPWIRNTTAFRGKWNVNYVGTYLQRDVARLFPGLDHDRFRVFLNMLGGLSGTILNYSDLARALGVSQPTARDYVDIAHGTFVWRRLPAFVRNPVKRTVRHPKGYLRDSGLLHHLLRIADVDMLLGHPAVGRSWEGMVIEEVLRALNGRGEDFDAYHYRTGAGGEIDLVLEGGFGLIAIEIKHSQSVRAQELQAMQNFICDCKCRCGLVINNDVTPRLYTDRIMGVPFSCL